MTGHEPRLFRSVCLAVAVTFVLALALSSGLYLGWEIAEEVMRVVWWGTR